ncbi:MAG TPA: hypothetical protein VEF76_00275 [Patescibacteria group bacterium]|nr:hypothetical protein [Patescibacteria group bacterium]
MTFEEFTGYVDLYSADLSRWPQHLVKPAVTFMKGNAKASALFERQLLADAQLRNYVPQDQQLSALEARIMSGLTDQAETREILQAAVITAQATRTSWRPAWMFAPTGGLLAALVVGYFVGFSPQREIYGPMPIYSTLDPAYVAEQQLATAYVDVYGEEGEVF